MATEKTTIYLGETGDKRHVYADVALEGSDGRAVTFTDHTTGPAPERVSISFTVATVKRRDPSTIPDSKIESCGQVPPEDRMVAYPAGDHASVIAQAWEDEHLNDMNAACDHMTAEMLTPSAEELEKFIASYSEQHPYAKFYGHTHKVQYWRMDNVVCPEIGYRWGGAWLARRPKAETVVALREIIHNNEQ